MMALENLLFAAILFSLGITILCLDVDTRNRGVRKLMVLSLLTLTAIYIGWRYEYTLPLFYAAADSLWPWLFFSTEVLTLLYSSWTIAVTVDRSDHSQEADFYERQLRTGGGDALPTVDVMIPTVNEDAEILKKTLRAAACLDYPARLLRICILDDGKRSWLQDMCEHDGVTYFSRPVHDHGKGGNLNYAFRRTSGNFILVIDADFTLKRNFLYRTLGFLLADRRVGLVQTPQHFRTPDPVQHNLGGSRAWTEEQHFFMTVIEAARDRFGNAFCVGSGFVARRSCLTELGGFPQASVTEDLELSYALLGKGYRTLFLNEPLAFGLAAESVAEYVKQRVRWCTGTIQQAFIKTGPLRYSELSWIDRLFYLDPLFYWLTYPFIVFILIAPIVFWTTGLAALTCDAYAAFFLLIPYAVARSVMIYWLSDRNASPIVTTIGKIVAVFHIAIAIVRTLIHPFGGTFQVTSKGLSHSGITVQWGLLLPFLSLIALLVGGLIGNLLEYRETVTINELTAFDVVWAFYSLLLLTLTALACIELPRTSAESKEVEYVQVGRSFRAILTRLFG